MPNATRSNWRYPALNHDSHISRVRASRGLVLVYVMLSMMIFIVIASLAVDMGHARLAKTQLQFAADAAACAACSSLPNGHASAQQAAVNTAAANTVDGTAVAIDSTNDIVFGTWDPRNNKFTVNSTSSANAVRVTASRTAAKGNAIQLTFAKLFNSGTSDLSASTTACYTGSAGAYSIIGMNSVAMSLTSFTDSYNAAAGPYASASANKKGSIASNGNISLANSAKVNGDARAGVGKSTSLAGTASVTGLTAPLGVVMTYPSASLPATYTDLGDVSMSSGTTSIPGGTYLIHNLNLSGTSHIIWTGPTVLYISQSYVISGGAQIDTYQNLPANRVLNFLPTCTTATWSGTNICVGDLYAPDTDFTVGGSVELFGRVLAHSIANSSSGGMHYDESLASPGSATLQSSLQIVQ